MRLALTIAALTVLSACASPQERCLQPVSRELSTLDALISETELSIARGYTYRTEPRRVQYGMRYCTGWYGGRGLSAGINLCGDTSRDVVRVPEAVDVETERRKLAELRSRRTKLQEALTNARTACAAQYPAG